MGRQTKLIKTERASKAFLSVTMSEFSGGSVAVEAAPEKGGLEISLYHLNLDVLSRVVEGDVVSVDVQTSPFRVITNKGHLGDVPTEYNASIILGQTCKRNRLKNLRRDPPGVRIRL